jgi:sulfur-oxidizing protein SoxZ
MMALARIQVPAQAKRGEAVEVRIAIQHPMETGFRRDANGVRQPRNAIVALVCRYRGAEVFRAITSPGVSANPSLTFWLRAERTGDLEFWWIDDENVEGSAKARLLVA